MNIEVEFKSAIKSAMKAPRFPTIHRWKKYDAWPWSAQPIRRTTRRRSAGISPGFHTKNHGGLWLQMFEPANQDFDTHEYWVYRQQTNQNVNLLWYFLPSKMWILQSASTNMGIQVAKNEIWQSNDGSDGDDKGFSRRKWVLPLFDMQHLQEKLPRVGRGLGTVLWYNGRRQRGLVLCDDGHMSCTKWGDMGCG